jgi:hypothetical protein
MTLKWMAVVVAAVSITVCVTMNAVSGNEVAAVVNMAAITLAGVATVIAVVSELYERIVVRIGALSDLVIARLDKLEQRIGDRNAGFVEGYLLGQPPDALDAPDAPVLPIGPRPRGLRAMNGIDD